ncbi:uncharacterized protein LOC128230668 [Mya arenaria]|uniref:uncharacterized protein LOC128230668 n=1 Tax=Mya arenaria TaxID=6604 RepID=UPI0022E1D7BD|nr:uncharacterized protein LOC128230668 [Mya arenaria]
MTEVTLELMTDIDQILFIEKGIRGGISQISNRYKKANNEYLNDYDPTKETSFLAYYYVNNLYGYSMSQQLPTGFFKFLEKEEIDTFEPEKIPEDGSKGYIPEVDLEYPKHLHDSHNDYPLAPERKFTPNEKLSPYAQHVLKHLHNSEELPPRAKVEKLLTTLENKQNYVLHYRNLQLYLQLGLKLKKIHKVLEFQQEAFMKPYVEFNTKMRQQAKTAFEKNFFKLMNNSVFGKTMENLRKHRSVELVHTEKRLQKVSSKPTYKMHRIFSEDLVGVELSRKKIKLNKPIFVGMSILDLSKYTMYDFYYNHLKNVYGSNVELELTDTDSFLVSCTTPDIFQDMLAYSHLFDTSDFPKDHFLYIYASRRSFQARQLAIRQVEEAFRHVN